MKTGQMLAWAVVLLLALALPASAAPGPKIKPLKVKVLAQGEAFCPAAALVYGTVVIQAGRCYTLFILRDGTGTFLAFGPAGPLAIPPGQLVRLSTRAGAKVRGRLFYLVSLPAAKVIIPVNTITSVPVRVEDFGPRLSITLVSTSAPNLVVVFNVGL